MGHPRILHSFAIRYSTFAIHPALLPSQYLRQASICVGRWFLPQPADVELEARHNLAFHLPARYLRHPDAGGAVHQKLLRLWVDHPVFRDAALTHYWALSPSRNTAISSDCWGLTTGMSPRWQGQSFARRPSHVSQFVGHEPRKAPNKQPGCEGAQKSTE